MIGHQVEPLSVEKVRVEAPVTVSAQVAVREAREPVFKLVDWKAPVVGAGVPPAEASWATSVGERARFQMATSSMRPLKKPGLPEYRAPIVKLPEGAEGDQEVPEEAFDTPFT